MTFSELRGLATGIGSLPHKDVESALDLIFEYTPNIAFWPQLPKRNVREGMVAQFAEGLPCIKATDKGLIFDPDNKEQELEKFYEKIINQELEYFKISQNFSQGLYAFAQRLEQKPSILDDIAYIKCQIVGPFTFASSINDENGRALLHDPVFMQAIISALTMKALWQIRFFKKFGKKIIVFLDEPYLGCFGSAYTPLSRQEVISGLIEITKRIAKPGIALTGIHCCGNTDWSVFTDVKTVDIISFDAFSFLDKLVLYSQDLKKFLQAGKALCWGIVPTQNFSGQETAELLMGKINAGINTLVKKGLDEKLILKHLMVSPSCGLGTLEIEKSTKIFQLLSEVSKEIFGNIT